MVSTAPTTAFHSPAPIHVRAAARQTYRPSTTTLRTTPSATATYPSKPATLPKQHRHHRIHRHNEQQQQQDHSDIEVAEYQAFLEGCPPVEREVILQTPVFRTGSGSLVCKVPDSAEGMMEAYQHFLNSDSADGIDTAAPVYLNSAGRLVCHVDRSPPSSSS